MTLSDFVKEYRKEHDLSQRQFAAICGLYFHAGEKLEP